MLAICLTHKMAAREFAWLHRVINHIETSCGIGALESPTIIY
jgi:hypothetical protein